MGAWRRLKLPPRRRLTTAAWRTRPQAEAEALQPPQAAPMPARRLAPRLLDHQCSGWESDAELSGLGLDGAKPEGWVFSACDRWPWAGQRSGQDILTQFLKFLPRFSPPWPKRKHRIRTGFLADQDIARGIVARQQEECLCPLCTKK